MPYGYQQIENRLVPDPAAQAVIAHRLQMNAAGASLRAIATVLNEAAVPANKDGIWHASTIRYLLANELHCQ